MSEQNPRITSIAVLGSGAWGTALACVAARGGNGVKLWGRNEEIISEINTQQTNQKYLSSLRLEKTIEATTNMKEAVSGADIILLCIPTQTLACVIEEIKPLTEPAMLVTCCKGIDRKNAKLPAGMIADAFPQNAVGVLSGPSFASDVVGRLPTAVTVAAQTMRDAHRLANILSNDTFRCYSSTDLKGVELGGALKNVLALAVGAARGMGLGASAEAALMARGFVELQRLAIVLGAKPETLSGLSGFGDLVLTCSSPQSRNFSYGMAMGEGQSLAGLKLAEGAHTASVALRIAQENNIDVPIIQAVTQVLKKQVTVREAVQQLLMRPLKRETES